MSRPFKARAKFGFRATQNQPAEWRLYAIRRLGFRGWLDERANSASLKVTFFRVCSQFRKSCNLCATFGVVRE